MRYLNFCVDDKFDWFAVTRDVRNRRDIIQSIDLYIGHRLSEVVSTVLNDRAEAAFLEAELDLRKGFGLVGLEAVAVVDEQFAGRRSRLVQEDRNRERGLTAKNTKKFITYIMLMGVSKYVL
jgi:hypothetical protein